MKTMIELINVMCYEKDNKETTRIAFRFLDKESQSNSKNFKGYGELAMYYNGREVFDKIPLELTGQAIDVIIEDVADYRNPLRTKKIIKSIEYKGNVITLV